MIIRSQNKTKILNFENLRTIKIEDLEFAEKGKKIIRGYGSASFTNLGEYSTEEKAIKVLDMIEKEYGKHFYGQGGELATANFYVPPFAFIPPKVFQMPADNEVGV